MDYRIFYVTTLTLAVTLHLQINPKADPGSECFNQTECDTVTETCNLATNSCDCNSLSQQSDSACVLNTTHGENCSVIACQVGLTCYGDVCGCVNGTYYNTSSCVPSSPALVPVITVITTTSDSLTVNWTRQDDPLGYTSTYVLDIGGNEHDLTNLTQRFTGLDSNTDYSVVIRRYITYNNEDQGVLESTPSVQIKTKSSHGQPCPIGEDCANGLTCYTGVSSPVCLCPEGSYYNGALPCLLSAPDLVPVIFDHTSAYNNFTITWNRTDDPLVYKSIYQLDYTGLDNPINISGENSPQTSQPQVALTANTTYTVTIRRILTFMGIQRSPLISAQYQLKTKSSHSQPCAIDGDCAIGLTCYTDGSAAVCLCSEGSYYNGALPCSPNSNLKPQITGNTTAYNSIRIDWSWPENPSGYSSRYTLEYKPGNTSDIHDTSPTQIKGLDPNTQYQVTIKRYITFNSVADREQAIPSDTVLVTTSKSGHKEQCSNDNSCMDGLECFTQSVCVCPDGRYYNGNLPCVEIRDLIPTFSLSSDRTNIYLTLTDIPDAGTLYTSTFEAQLNPGNRNISFISSSTSFDALTEGTMYDVTVTRILTLNVVGKVQTTTPSQPQNISTKVSYNNTCSRNGICIDNNTDCHNGRCLCNPKYYWRVGSCRDISDLAPVSVQAEVLDTTSVKVTWQLSSDISFVSAYRVDATPTSTSDPHPSAVNVTGGGATTTTLTGLQPGTQFRFTVESKSTNDGRVEYVSGNSVDKVTNPAKITGLDEPNSNFSAPIMKIAFQPGAPKFTGYTVILSGDGGYREVMTASWSGATDNYYYAEFNSVVPGKYYNIEVVTISEQNSMSEPFTDRRRAMVAQASEVVDLKNDTVTSRSAIINWKRPEEPNGKLFEYSLEISLNNECQSRIIFDCRECPRNLSQPNDTAPSCKNVTNVTITKDEIDDDNYIVEHNVTSLDPDTNYDIQAVAYNEEGRGKLSNSLQVHTYSEPARTPKSVTTRGLTSNSVILSWIPETPRPGTTSYVVEIRERNVHDNEFHTLRTEPVFGYYNNSLDVETLSSYWEYQFSVKSQSEVGQASGSVQTNVIRTLESAPTQVVDLEAKAIPDVYDKVQLIWKCPTQKDGRNGVILSATVKYKTDTLREGVTPTFDEQTIKNPGDCSWNVELNLTPEFNYTFTVYISNSIPGASRVISKYMPPGPAVIREGVVSKQQKEVSEKENSFPFTICPRCLRDGRNGLVESSGILVCKNTCPTTQKKRETITKDHYEQVDNWQKASAANFNKLFRVTISTWLDHVPDQDKWVYEIGQNSSCDKSVENGFCNGPLPEGSTYLVKVFICTAAGCDESEPVSIKTKEPPSYTNVIVGAVCGVLAAIVIVIAVIVFLKWRKRKGDNSSETPTPANDESELIRRKRPITLHDFPEKVDNMHRDSNLLFSEEFEDITAISPKHNAIASETGGNKLKNRYVNILPFDHSRVKLLQLEDEDEETDYLNANYIPGYRSVREYIATQGPMTGTINDFWRMIWEQKVPIIVMLSDLQEKGRPKVDRYYPENMEPVNYGDIRVEMTNFSPLSKYVIRIFKIEMGEEIRTVRHYFLPGWQDFGANLTSDNVIDFIKSVRMEIKPNNTGPLCIHCSAGVGRTGTYITLDVFQQHIDEEVMDKELDVFDFVMKMRQNRSHMVQTEKQYIFIHDTIKEMVIRKKKEMAERDKNVYMNSGTDDDLYVNQAFETDPNDIYMNVDTRTGKPTTAL